MLKHEFKVDLHVNGVVHIYNVQIEPWNEFRIHPKDFDCTKDSIAEKIAEKANPQQFADCDEYGVWFQRIANTFHGNVRDNPILHIKTINKKTKAILT